MMNLLFVDDEVAILESLSDSLRCRRGEWTCHFAASGKEALELLSTKEFDIVVSDMRMPGMDGAEFLAAVQERWPKIARLILSGQADSDSLTRALPVTHQFLAKPCEPDKLIQTVGTILELRSRTHDRAVLEIVGKSGTLPSLEPHLAKLSELLATGGSSSQIAEVVACDLALSSRILQVANSPYFGPSRSISSLAEAISFTGLNLLKSILISCQARRLAPGASAQQLAAFSERDLKIATLARTITAYAPDAEQAFSVGLLSNIGQYVLLQTDPMRYPQLLRTHGEREIHVHERELYGTTHAEIGAFLLGLWGLPLSIVTNVADHHTPSKIRQSTVLSTLEIATGLAYGSTYEETFDLARSGQLAPLNLSESAIANLTECQKPNAA